MGRAPCSDETKNNSLKRGPWTPDEDKKLIDYIRNNGYGNWRTLPKNAGLQRCGKSCRLRWTNYLRPDIKRGRFSLQEEDTIIHLHSILGNKWSVIASRLPGRTDNEIKNYWNTHIRKRLLRMGIDPVTHSLRFDLLDLSSIINSSLHNNPSHIDISMLLGSPQLINPSQYDLNLNGMQNLHPNETQSQLTTLPQHVAQTTSTPTSCIPFSSPCDQAQISDMSVGFDCSYPINDGFGVQSLEDQTQGFHHTVDTWQMFGDTNNAITGHVSSWLDANVINQHDYATSCNGFQNSGSSTFSSQISSFSSVLSTPSSSSAVTWNSNSNSDSTYITSENEESCYSSLFKFN